MPKILIVDDNEEAIRRPLVRQLGRVFGPDEILEATNGQDALFVLYAQEEPVGVIILDIMMPVMDGIAACKAIRDNPDHEGVYIAMLTGRDGGLPEGLEVGADVYLRKPCDTDELIAVVKKGLQAFEKHQQQKSEQADLVNQLQQSEQEKRDLQQQNSYVEIPSFKGEFTNWLDIVDQSI